MQSKNETGGGDGVEIIENRRFEGYPLLGNDFSVGQYTKKKYHLANKVNGVVRTILPRDALVLEENAWNAYPFCRTILTNDYLKDFNLAIETFHAPGKPTLENVHNLSPELLAQREVILIDIAADVDPSDYLEADDPRKFKPKIVRKNPLGTQWINNAEPIMTCYKLVYCEFKYFGLQARIEELIHRNEKRLFTKFHRKLYCSIDEWYHLNLDDVRKLEDQIKHELEVQRVEGNLRGNNTLG